MSLYSRNDLLTKKIGVLMGGLSAEREISLKTGQAALSALLELGYQAVAIDVGHDLATQLAEQKVAVAFICLHGRFGEDGRVQGLLEMQQIPYTGSGVMTSAVAIDKVMTKKVLIYHGLPTPEFEFAGCGDSLASLVGRCRQLPLVVKPSREGSTLGITIAKSKADLLAGIEVAATMDGTVLVEDFIDGAELTVSVLNGQVLPIIQIVAKSGFYDYQAKYLSGDTEYLLPAPLDTDSYQRIQQAALEAYQVLGCRGAARVDFMFRERNFYCIEVNTIPGMTPTSLLPKAAREAGITFNQLVEAMLMDAGLDK